MLNKLFLDSATYFIFSVLVCVYFIVFSVLGYYTYRSYPYPFKKENAIAMQCLFNIITVMRHNCYDCITF